MAAVLIILLLAAGARVAIMRGAIGRLDDPDGYLGLARSLVAGKGFEINGRPTAYRPPLYPIVLAPLITLGDGPHLAVAVGGLHLALGLATVALVADVARRWGLPRRACWAAAIFAACDPVLVVQGRAVMTETLAALLLAASLWGTTFAGRRGAILGGFGFGLATLCRPSLLPAAGLTALIGMVAPPGGRSERMRWSACLLGATAAVLAPWAVRNALVLGEPVWTTTHGGYTFALANNPAYYADVLDGPPGAVWSGPHQQAWIESINAATAGLSEAESDRFLRREAVALARDRPGDFVRASLARLGRFWGVMPAAAVYPTPLRWATAAWTVPAWVLLGAGLVDRRSWRRPRLAAGASIVALTCVHAAYWTDLRMRAPLVPAIALVAASGLVRVGFVGRNEGAEGVN